MYFKPLALWTVYCIYTDGLEDLSIWVFDSKLKTYFLFPAARWKLLHLSRPVFTTMAVGN